MILIKSLMLKIHNKITKNYHNNKIFKEKLNKKMIL